MNDIKRVDKKIRGIFWIGIVGSILMFIMGAKVVVTGLADSVPPAIGVGLLTCVISLTAVVVFRHAMRKLRDR